MMFLILFTISSIVMYVLDALIAFTIPASRVEKRLSDGNTVGLLTNLYGKGVWKAIRPDIENSANTILEKYTNSLEQRVTTHITNVVTNDLAHMIDDKIEGLRDEVPARSDFETLISTLKGIISSTGVKGKELKKQERMAKIAWIQQNAPEKLSMVNRIMMGKKLMGASQSDVDQAIDLLMFDIQQQQGDGLNGQEIRQMSPLQAGPHIQEVPALQKKSEPEEANLGPLSGNEAKEIIEDIVGKDIVNVIEKEKEFKLEREVKEGEQNGKTKEKGKKQGS